MTREKKIGYAAWGVLIAGTGAYEALCPQNATLSETLDDFVDRPIGKLVVGTIGAITVAHLINILPHQIDPFSRAGELKDKIKGWE
jgi:hypothetical protein